MKKIKRKFPVVLSFIVMAMMILPSCSKDEDSDDGLSALVGTWVYKEQMSYFTKEYKYVFTKDHRYTWSALNVEMEKGTYALDGHVITLTPDEDHITPSTLWFEPNGSLPNIYDSELDIEYTKQ